MKWIVERISQLARWARPQKTLGELGEQVAAKFLRSLGYTIVARGDRGRLGEIDLVAVDVRTIVFVEVKTRSSHYSGHPSEAVNRSKQTRLTKQALTFLRRHDLLEQSARFDVVSITWPDQNVAPKVEHIQNAFEAVGKWQMFR